MNNPDEIRRTVDIVANYLLVQIIESGNSAPTPDQLSDVFQQQFPELFDLHANWLLFDQITEIVSEKLKVH